MMLRRIDLPALLNFRDLGGYAAGAKGMTIYRKYFRSDAPANISSIEIDHILNMGVETVIDLRTKQEQVQAPCKLAGVSGIQFHSVPLIDNAMVPLSEGEMPLFYQKMLHSETVAKVFEVLAECNGSALFHCTAGKDRTGVIAAVLLWLAGVAREDIVADYQVSQTYLKPLMDKLKKDFPEMPMHAVNSKPEYMEQLLDDLCSTYKLPEYYLMAQGLTQSTIDALLDGFVNVGTDEKMIV